MLTDFETVDAAAFADRVYDVAVIGAGPAGITLARQLAAKGWTVGLFEGGGLDISAESQEVYEGEIVGQDYFSLDTVRLRYFGGTSNHWSGWCHRLDSYDFRPNPVNPLSGWPIAKSDLDPYAPGAASILDLPAAAGTEMNDAHDPASPIAADKGFEKLGFFYSPPTRFNQKYIEEMKGSDKIHLFINANIVDLKLNDGLSSVSEGVFRGYEREDAVGVKARFFALCLGGIENPRFLLNCTGQITAGIGNENDLVGRYFADHPHIDLGEVKFSTLRGGLDIYAPSPAFMAEHRTLNFGLRVLSLPPESAARLLARQAVCLTEFTAETYVSLTGKTNFDCGTVTLHIAQEQALNPDSRVRLGSDTDRFGKRRLILDWRLSDVDFHTMRTAAIEFGRVLALEDYGRLKIADWLLADPPVYPSTDSQDEIIGFHHMCTTRMSADPKTGVVNADCRLHGVDNLYLGGSSVFATTGHANPTFSIVQLALRLGDHLDARLKA